MGQGVSHSARVPSTAPAPRLRHRLYLAPLAAEEEDDGQEMLPMPPVLPRQRRAVAALTGDPDKRVVILNVQVTKDCRIPDAAKIYNFMTPSQEHACWRPSLVQAVDFAEGLADPPNAHFRGRAEIRLYFPVYSRYYVYKSYTAGAAGGFTLLRVLKLFEVLAEVAIAHYLRHAEGQKDIRRRDVHKLLRNYAICSLRVKDNRVYAITHDAREKLP